MFKFFKKAVNTNKIWQVLNEYYFNELNGRIGNTVLKVENSSETVNSLLVHTDNENVRKILTDNEQRIISDLKSKADIFISSIKFV